MYKNGFFIRRISKRRGGADLEEWDGRGLLDHLGDVQQDVGNVLFAHDGERDAVRVAAVGARDEAHGQHVVHQHDHEIVARGVDDQALHEAVHVPRHLRATWGTHQMLMSAL